MDSEMGLEVEFLKSSDLDAGLLGLAYRYGKLRFRCKRNVNLEQSKLTSKLAKQLRQACEAVADEELVDPKKYYEESCKPKCVKPLLEYQACVKRIQNDETGHKHCTGQYFDYWACIDKCVAPKLFSKLK
ncbi:hypothetical protein ACSBR2_018756 [Camellia fascicularis]